MTLKIDAKEDWRKTDLLFQNWQEFGEFLSEYSKVSKICTLIGSLHGKYVMFDLKMYRGVIFHGTRKWCKIRRKTDLWFGKKHVEFGKFLPEHLKVGNQNWDFHGVLLSQVENVWA